MIGRLLTILSACVLATLPCASAAQEPAAAEPVAVEPAEPPAAVAAPIAAPVGSDLVRLRDGSEWRETIVESVAQSHVILVTYTGEAKRIEESELLYAGPASLAPQSPSPENIPQPPSASDRPAGTVRLTLRPARKLSIYLDDGRGLTRACEGECIADVPPGRYRTGLGREGRSPVPAPGSIEIQEDDQTTEPRPSSPAP